MEASITTSEEKIPVECSIEQILGATLKQLTELSDEEWLARLEPIIKRQESVLAKLPKQRAEKTSIPGSKMGKGGGTQPHIRAGRDPVSMLKAGMSAEQATMSLLTNLGVQFTPEMLLQMKQGKKK